MSAVPKVPLTKYSVCVHFQNLNYNGLITIFEFELHIVNNMTFVYLDVLSNNCIDSVGGQEDDAERRVKSARSRFLRGAYWDLRVTRLGGHRSHSIIGSNCIRFNSQLTSFSVLVCEDFNPAEKIYQVY